ncbi:MAG TPA: hypothetical protein VGR33_05840 [Actinomycetota bacterium]|jgi:hypothetical protein|nr:hypothetical protein [Actinomycetota bacterium]
MPRILVATADGLHELGDGAVLGRVHHAGRVVTTVAQGPKEFWTVVDGSEVWHTADLNRWTHLADMVNYRATCIAAMNDDMLVGSSQARLFRVVGEGLESVSAFDRAEGRSTWYTPWGGPPDTRSISEWDEAVYVNVHVGGILRTEDRGETWTPTIDIDADVHQVTTAEGLVLAASAGGLAMSTDRGEAWTFRSEGLEAAYSRAVTVCGDAVLVSASRGPRGGHAAVYRGALAGGGLERCRTGLSEWFDDNIDSYCLDAHPDRSFVAFGTSDGRVFASEDAGRSWAEFASGLPSVRRVLVLP